jgi:hypothetical protein
LSSTIFDATSAKDNFIVAAADRQNPFLFRVKHEILKLFTNVHEMPIRGGPCLIFKPFQDGTKTVLQEMNARAAHHERMKEKLSTIQGV